MTEKKHPERKEYQAGDIISSGDHFYSLVLKDGEAVVPIIRNVSVGSAPSNTISLKNKKISKMHVKIIKKNDKFILKDLGSKTGTKVNGSAVSEAELKNGDIIEIGGTSMIFKED